MSSKYEKNVYLAMLAEQCNRFEEMVQFLEDMLNNYPSSKRDEFKSFADKMQEKMQEALKEQKLMDEIRSLPKVEKTYTELMNDIKFQTMDKKQKRHATIIDK